MNWELYLTNAMIPFLLTAVLGFYGARLLIKKDAGAIRGKDRYKKLKDEKKYAETAGKLILFLAAASLGMAIIMIWSGTAAFVEIFVCMIIFGLLWRKMDDKYGEIR